MTTSPRIYVGTYAKYNSGSIAGKWLDLEDYSDKEAFLEACAELHKDEIPENLRSYFDYEAYARDMKLGGDVWTAEHGGETWVFWNR